IASPVRTSRLAPVASCRVVINGFRVAILLWLLALLSAQTIKAHPATSDIFQLLIGNLLAVLVVLLLVIGHIDPLSSSSILICGDFE
ncbi:MAG: hypothetical protein CBC13_02725, partial [Planctomycetia bacterium TMED53]